MIHNLCESHSLISNWVAELRDVNVQGDRMRFRLNLERIAEVIGFEISKTLPSKKIEITTPMANTTAWVLADQPVLATILRAGLGMHNGLLRYFDKADNAFLSAYRKHEADGSFDIKLEYMSSPSTADKIVLLSDPMLATGASLVKAAQYLNNNGIPRQLHIVCAIACNQGLNYVTKALPNAHVWCATIDETLTDKGYIIPGLGDAGDLAYGGKMQH